LKNKVILITGSTDGIGKQCALELARKGATVLLHGRNPSLGKTVLEQSSSDLQNDKLGLFVADFASLKQVRRLADEILDKHTKLDVLVNNAGVYMRDRQLTEDGFEVTFGVNHLAPFLLTNLLLDLLKKSAPSKIINVSSMVHQNAPFDFHNLQGEKRFDAYDAYSTSKLANLLFTYVLANRLHNSGVTVNALHPGVIATKMLRAGFGSMGGRPVEDGAARIEYLIETPGIENASGKYFVNDKEQTSSPHSRDEKLQKQFWALSEKMVGLSKE
jgi:Dehydrogenases with different specificities (related to short-chain alcohol dehydrogenases)